MSNDSVIYLIREITTCAEKYAVLHKWIFLFNSQKRLQLFFGCSTIFVTLVLLALIIFQLAFYFSPDYSWFKQQHKFNLWNILNLFGYRIGLLEDLFVYCISNDLENCMTEPKVKYSCRINFPTQYFVIILSSFHPTPPHPTLPRLKYVRINFIWTLKFLMFGPKESKERMLMGPELKGVPTGAI